MMRDFPGHSHTSHTSIAWRKSEPTPTSYKDSVGPGPPQDRLSGRQDGLDSFSMGAIGGGFLPASNRDDFRDLQGTRHAQPALASGSTRGIRGIYTTHYCVR